MLIHFRNKRSGHVAKDRLKLLLVFERLDCSPQMMTMLQNDMIRAVSRYFTVQEQKVEIRYLKDTTTVLAKIPLKADIQESYPGFLGTGKKRTLRIKLGVFMIKQYKLRDYNFRLVLFLVVLTFMGVLLVGSAEPDLQKKQFFGMMLGFIVMVIISLMDFSWILNFYWIMYVGNILMLLLVRLFGTESKGAARWLSIGSFQFQPTELSKIIIILFLARYLMEHEEDLNTFKTILKTVVLIAIPLLLIYNQPDLKNTITIAILFCILLYLAGLSYKIIGGALLIAIPLVVVFLFIVIQPDQKLIKDYQRDRIMTFLYPEEEEYSDDVLQQQNSIMAIGSGKLTGKGLNNNEVATANKGNFVSESQTDFIFSVAGEELGFLGCTALLLLMFFDHL